MRLGPIEIGRHRPAPAAVEAAAQTTVRTDPEQGASGTLNLSGFLQPFEYNPDLRGPNGLKIYERMLRSDGSVSEAFGHISEPVKNAIWDIQPATDDLLDLEVGEATRRAFFQWLHQPWIELLDSVLEYPAKGHAVFEMAMMVVEDELTFDLPGQYDVDPVTRKRKLRTHTVPARQFLTFKRFAPRLQETIWRWNMDDGELVSIEQQALKDGVWGNWLIPAEDLLVFTHRKRGEDFTGLPLLRPAYKAWKVKELVEKVAGAAVDRHGLGTIVGYLPEAFKDDAAAMARLEEILKNVRSGAFGYIAAPGPKAMATRDGYTFEILNPSGTIPDFGGLLNYLRAEIKAAVLARFAELGHATTGARATGDIQSIVWFAALHAVARYICDVFQQAVVRFVDANYNVTAYPKLVASDIESRNLAEFAEAVSRLVLSGAITADDSFEEWARQAVDAPDKDDDEDQQQQTESDATDPNVEPETQPGDPGAKP